MLIRSAHCSDAQRLLDIYSYYVENTAVSFEYDVPTVDEFSKRIENTLQKYPYLVIEEKGNIWGYAYASALGTRKAYDHSCELSIYLDPCARRRGYGKALYSALESHLEKMGILNMYACVACPIGEDTHLTRDSELFHQHLGFYKVGEFHQCGLKFETWYNILWMEKIIGSHDLLAQL